MTDRTIKGFDPDKTREIHERMKALPDDQKSRFAINWRIAHSVFNVAVGVWPDEAQTTLQEVDWHKIWKSFDLGNWSHGGKVYVMGAKA